MVFKKSFIIASSLIIIMMSAIAFSEYNYANTVASNTGEVDRGDVNKVVTSTPNPVKPKPIAPVIKPRLPDRNYDKNVVMPDFNRSIFPDKNYPKDVKPVVPPLRPVAFGLSEKIKSELDSNYSDFLAVRKKFKAVEDKSEKDKVRKELQEKTRLLLIAQLKAIIEKLKSVESNGMDDNETRKAIEVLEKKLNTLQNSQDLNVSNLQAVSVESKKIFERNEARVKAKIGLEMAEKYLKVIAKAEAYSKRLGEIISSLKAAGKDTSDLETAKRKLDKDIESIKSTALSLKEKFAAANNKEETLKVMKEAHNQLRIIHKEIQKDIILIRLAFIGAKEISEKGGLSVNTTDEMTAVISGEASNTTELNVPSEELIAGGELQ
jgi:DNA repair exonuclease SbcCD ATPase subunit